MIMNVKNNNTNEKSHWFDYYEYQEEQKKLENYIRLRPLPRPKTRITTVVVWLLIQFFLPILISFTLICIFQIVSCKWLIYLISYIAVGFLFLKKICIKLIECYQHYGKEEIRRRCICVPSCSEYAIAVLKKYNVLKALHKIRIRLFKTCNSIGYVRDEP